jgi:hypothetical protein
MSRDPYFMAHGHDCHCDVHRADSLYTLRGAWELGKCLIVLALAIVAVYVYLLLAAPDLTAAPSMLP